MNNFVQLNISKTQKIIKYILIYLISSLLIQFFINSVKCYERTIISLFISMIYALLDMISPTIKIYKKIN